NVGANVTTFTDSNRPAGTYTYRLNAFTSNNIYSGISNDVTVVIGTNTTTPNTSVTPPASTNVPNTTTNTETNNGVAGKIDSFLDKTVNNINTFINTPTTTPPASTNTTPSTQTNLIKENTVKTSEEISKPIIVTSEFSLKVQDIGSTIEGFQNVNNNLKDQLVKKINENVDSIVNNTEVPVQKNNIEKINNLRDSLLEKINSNLSVSVNLNSTDVNNLKNEIDKGINNIKKIAGESTVTPENQSSSTKDITNTLNTIVQTVNNQAETLKSQGADLIYKDTNKDGISDYDSVHVYNMNPVLPSPVSNYDGKVVNAADKILLGYDPTKTELVKIPVEQPAESNIAPVTTYKVKEVSLTTDKKEIVIKGQALPNSFITLYIYSTPIMVTVKTDSKGEWQYTLDKELENGDHTVYTATVNNSGNIIAKSSGYLFTKTAEAATLKEFPAPSASVSVNRPGMFGNNNNLLLAIVISGISLMIILIILAIPNKKKEK
ncbi:MAG: Ig-like domain-containing protein, partial [bacterium]